MSLVPDWHQVAIITEQKIEIESLKLHSTNHSREEDLIAKGRIQAFKEILNIKRTLELRAASAATNGRT